MNISTIADLEATNPHRAINHDARAENSNAIVLRVRIVETCAVIHSQTTTNETSYDKKTFIIEVIDSSPSALILGFILETRKQGKTNTCIASNTNVELNSSTTEEVADYQRRFPIGTELILDLPDLDIPYQFTTIDPARQLTYGTKAAIMLTINYTNYIGTHTLLYI